MVDLCTDDPGKNVDLYISSTLHSLAEVWMGDTSIAEAAKKEGVSFSGASYLMQTASHWIPTSRYADIRPKRFTDRTFNV